MIFRISNNFDDFKRILKKIKLINANTWVWMHGTKPKF